VPPKAVRVRLRYRPRKNPIIGNHPTSFFHLLEIIAARRAWIRVLCQAPQPGPSSGFEHGARGKDNSNAPSVNPHTHRQFSKPQSGCEAPA
jgi:hypothetical protein